MIKTKQKTIQVRLKEENKDVIVKAASLRHIPTSDYIRTVVLAQATKEVKAAENEILRLTEAEQLVFWNALQAPVKLTEGQKRLRKVIRENK